MKKLTYLSILFVSLLSSSCTKPTTKTVTPSKSDTTKTVVTNKDYFPTSIGSSWQFEWSWATNVDSQFEYVTGQTIQFNGKTYHEIKSTGPSFGISTLADYYITKVNGIYYGYNYYVSGLEQVLYKDSAKVGDKWSDTLKQSNSVTQYSTIVEDTGITLFVRGKAYSNVVHYVCTTTTSGTTKNYTYDCYNAKGIGLVKRTESGGGGNYIEEISNYIVK